MTALPFDVLEPAPHGGAQLDPLADALDCLALRSWIPGQFELRAPWGLRMATHVGWFYVVVERGGQCEMCAAGTRLDLTPGDLLVVGPGHEHCLRDRPDSPPTPIQHVLERRHFTQRVPLVHGGGGDVTRLFCGCFLLGGVETSPLRTGLPEVLHVPGRQQRPVPYVQHILGLLDLEAAESDPDTPILMDRLVRILLRKALQSCLRDPSTGRSRWLRAIADPEIGRTLALMHAQPATPWTVASLADRVAMARSSFAARFAELVGQPPLQYLTQWRIQKACALLRSTQAELKQVAAEVGYESPAAFSKAFTRWTGISPGAYRRAGAVASGPTESVLTPV